MKAKLTHEGIERVTIVRALGPGMATAGRYVIRRADGSEEYRAGPDDLTGDVTVRLLRIDGVALSGEPFTLRVMETCAHGGT